VVDIETELERDPDGGALVDDHHSERLRATVAWERLGGPSREGIRTTLGSILVSSVLAAVKVAAGIVGNSYALVADGIESLLDIVSSFLVVGSLKLASTPPSERFPYGLGKVESLGGLAVATVLLGAAAGIAVESVREIMTPHRAPAAFTLVVLVVVVIVKVLLFRRLRARSEAIGSHAMAADAWHHRSDALTSVAAFFGISIALWGGPGWESADAWAALFASLVIAWNGARLFRAGWFNVLDQAPPPERIAVLRQRVLAASGVRAIDLFRTRRSGLGLFVDLHVVVDGDISVREGHDIAHEVKKALIDEDQGILDVVVHVEPWEPDRRYLG
jgi:cation diffusion facilitator family transporter